MTRTPAQREHLIDALIIDNWTHPATTGEQPGYWREAASKSYVIVVKGFSLRVYHRDLLRDYAGQVALFRTWLDSLPMPTDTDAGLSSRQPA